MCVDYVALLNEQRSIFVSAVQWYSGPVLGNPVLNAKILTVVTGFLRKPSVICWQLKFSKEDIQPPLQDDIWFTDSPSVFKSAKYASMPYHKDILGEEKRWLLNFISFPKQFKQLCLGALLCLCEVSSLILFLNKCMQEMTSYSHGWLVTVQRGGIYCLASRQSGGFGVSRFPDSLVTLRVYTCSSAEFNRCSQLDKFNGFEFYSELCNRQN